jgi:hypothetical protein
VKTLLSIILLFAGLDTGATHWLTYYVYFETTYLQGPWVRTDILAKSRYVYLAPRAYEDLFGTERYDLVEKMFSRLREDKPEVYDWDYQISLMGDTVVLKSEGPVRRRVTVANEVLATMTLNGFKVVRFEFDAWTDTCTLSDLTLPYFDLVEPLRPGMEPGRDNILLDLQEPGKNRPVYWLVISVLLNVIMVGFLVFRSKR